MIRPGATDRPPSRRRPLGDATSRANHQEPDHGANRAPYSSPMSSNPRIVHHESLKPDGQLQIRSSPPAPRSPANPRISAVIEEHRDESKRDSQISTTSTQASGASRRKTHIGPWRLGRTLGQGSVGRVRLAKHELTGQYAAIKIVSKKSAAIARSESLICSDMRNAVGIEGEPERLLPFGIEREVVIMKLIKHPHVMQLYDVWENRKELYLVLEYVQGGELFDYLVQSGRLLEDEAIKYFRQIITALAYCHSFNIYHRDLKPENILLDENKDIKLADFGMAALQPTGTMLKTACGSPHYAAPELIRGIEYTGEKTDIWSCGIILFVLLTGFTPFESRDLNRLLKKIIDGNYAIPSKVSAEAQDLIVKMLQPDPKNRPTLKGIMKHPLITKYEHAYPRLNTTTFRPPSVREVGRPVKHRSDIDREILRNLQTLWHGEKEEVVIRRLLNEEPNQEKMFYRILLEYRIEHLENYEGQVLQHSASDYHHYRQLPRYLTAPRALTHHDRSRSRFSIATDHRSPRLPPTSETLESYDPFRPSQEMARDGKPEYTHVTVLRGRSAASRARVGSNARHAAVARLQVQGRDHSQSSRSSRSHSSRGQAARSKSASGRRGSRSSLASVRSNGSPVVVRATHSYKRSVSFVHSQRSSASNVSKAKLQAEAQRIALNRYSQSSPLSNNDMMGSSPPVPQQTNLRVRKNTNTGGRSVQVPKIRATSHLFTQEARKVSTELEAYCDEVFNRSSIASSRTAATATTRDSGFAYKTPMSSYCEQENSGSNSPCAACARSPLRYESPVNKPYAEDRPLPAPPPATAATTARTPKGLDSYTTRELADTRERLLKRAAEGGQTAGQDYLKDVIAHLDRLLQPPGNNLTVPAQNEERRVVSGPPDYGSDYLPAISEEAGRYSDASDQRTNDQRVASKAYSDNTANARPPTRRAHAEERDSIRVVQPSSPSHVTHIAPLTIRKRSAGYSTIPPPARGDDPKKASRAGGAEEGRESIWDGLASPSLEPFLEEFGTAPSNKGKGRANVQDYAWEPVTKVVTENEEFPMRHDPPKKSGWWKPLGRKSSHGRLLEQPAFVIHADDDAAGAGGAAVAPAAASAGAGVDQTMGVGTGRYKSWREKEKALLKEREKSNKRHSEAPSHSTEGSGEYGGTAGRKSGFRKFFGMKEKGEKGEKGVLKVVASNASTPSLQSHASPPPTPTILTHTKPTAPTTLTNRDNHTNHHRRSNPLQPHHISAPMPLTSSPPPHSCSSHHPRTKPRPQPHQNWFARLMRIQPERRILCLAIPARRARRELVSLLRSWRAYGLVGVGQDRERGVCWGRVDAANGLGLKPVEFFVEVLTLLDRGRRCGQCLARFTQERGSATAFVRVVAEVEKVMGERGGLVREGERVREMRAAVGL